MQLQSTDTHYYVKNGNGLFNWRMKFKFDVPCRYPRLTFKVWSTEWLSLSPNQAVGVAVIDLDFLVAIAAAHSGDDPIERARTLVRLTQGWCFLFRALQLAILFFSRFSKNCIQRVVVGEGRLTCKSRWSEGSGQMKILLALRETHPTRTLFCRNPNATRFRGATFLPRLTLVDASAASSAWA